MHCLVIHELRAQAVNIVSLGTGVLFTVEDLVASCFFDWNQFSRKKTGKRLMCFVECLSCETCGTHTHCLFCVFFFAVKETLWPCG